MQYINISEISLAFLDYVVLCHLHVGSFFIPWPVGHHFYIVQHIFSVQLYFLRWGFGALGLIWENFSHLHACFHALDFCIFWRPVLERVLVVFELPLFWNDGGRCALVTIKCSRNTFCNATQIGDNYVDYYLSFRFFLFQFAKNKLWLWGQQPPLLPLALFYPCASSRT